MMMIHKQLAIFIIGAIGAGAVIPRPSFGDPLATWERSGHAVSYDEILKHADAVRGMAAPGDAEVLARLLGIAASKRQDMMSRSVAISVACDIADPTGAAEIFELMESYRNGSIARQESGNDEPSSELVEAHALFVRGFVARDAQKLVRLLPSDEVALRFLKDFLFSDRGRGGSHRQQCYRLIEECEVPPAVRRATALEAVNRVRSSPGIAQVLLDMLDNAALPQLRDWVRAGTTPENFHFSAAAALAHLGDAEILTELQARWAVFVQEDPENAKYYNTYFDLWIWQIQVQSSSEGLLEYIASEAPDPPGRREHVWAVRRALKRGIEPQLIREAIVRNSERSDSAYGRVMVRNLKREGLRLGILHPDDLPGVEVRNYERTP